MEATHFARKFTMGFKEQDLTEKYPQLDLCSRRNTLIRTLTAQTRGFRVVLFKTVFFFKIVPMKFHFQVFLRPKKSVTKTSPELNLIVKVTFLLP